MKQKRDRSLWACSAAVAITAIAGTAHGQYVGVRNCTISQGPDVIVGVITGPTNYATEVENGVTYDAFALGTTSCNLGDVPLQWITSSNYEPADGAPIAGLTPALPNANYPLAGVSAPTGEDRHPVIGGNLYKYSQQAAGYYTFEQIGQSWLKNAFTALQNSDCGTCLGTVGSHLGVCCSDPYSSSRNGSQSSFGGMVPRWAVNPTTGRYTLPAPNPAFSGSTDRRIKFRVSDAPNSNGTTIRYFGECQYVCPDDALAVTTVDNYGPVGTTGNPPHNNRDNNASSILMTHTNGTLALSGSTFRRRSAIENWKVLDPTVTESVVQADGKFIVSSKATDIGGGWWHYEYAVYNMNSDRSAGGFRVPIDPNLPLTDIQNVGFHDVFYHSGDGEGNIDRDGTDWVGNKVGSEMMWQTAQNFASNSNGNAIRWGTTYNFRFDAKVPPKAELGLVTLSMFKPGAVGEYTAAAQVPDVVPNPPGACCVGAACTTGVFEADCTGSWSIGNSCEWLVFCCPTDFNRDGVKTINDFFGFLAFWFSSALHADWNQNNNLDVGDVFAFLAEWFVPC